MFVCVWGWGDEGVCVHMSAGTCKGQELELKLVVSCLGPL